MLGSPPTTIRLWHIAGASERLAWQAGARCLVSLSLLVAMCLMVRLVVQAASLSGFIDQPVLSGTAPETADALGEDSIGDGMLPTPLPVANPMSPRFALRTAALFPRLPTPHPIPHPPQLTAA
jgi:hypothetical protein